MDTLQLYGAGPDGSVAFCKKRRREKALDLLGVWQSEYEPEGDLYVPKEINRLGENADEKIGWRADGG